MKRHLISVLYLLLISMPLFAQWQAAGNKISTAWAQKVSPDNVLGEYPRPLMERTAWTNLNGLWQYAVTSREAAEPLKYEGNILVPFAIESSLSGVGKTVKSNQALWYMRSFDVPRSWKGGNLLLHFGAVDWKADVWVNGIKVGSHSGGYTPFSFDITAALSSKGENRLVVKVWDPTDEGYQPRGKQVNKPGSIWYTSVTGIWQTVWMEPVAPGHIENLRITPDIDNNTLTIEPILSAASSSQEMVEVKVYDEETLVFSGKSSTKTLPLVAQGRSINNQPVVIAMPDEVKLWSPDSPNLYTLEVTLSRNGKQVDKVMSYAAMRKFSTGRDKDGYMRLMLNNHPIFQFGPLDQGWWPDGLYTAPTDEALKYDIEKTKEWGFNMIRKHVKVEPARWYSYCDRMGIIVWQDMPSGDGGPEWQNYNYFNGTEWKRSPESEANYRKEWAEIMDYLYSNPCVGVWVPFNEAWGQFKCPEIALWTKQHDPTRLVNPASGGNHYTCGDILDVHHYSQPAVPLYDAQRVTVLGEYGGIGMAVEGHLWVPDRNWGYVQYKTADEVTAEFLKDGNLLKDLIGKGTSAAVYTQTTDVEVEVNGLMTYDRKVIKINEKEVGEMNRSISHSLDEK